MSTWQELLLLSLALTGIGLVWWADGVMAQDDDELITFAQHADLLLDA